MSKTITRQTKVYAIEELKKLDSKAYETALDALREIAWEIYDPEEISQDVADYYMEEEHGFSVNTRTEQGYSTRRKTNFTITRPDLFWGDYSLGFNGTVKDLGAKIRQYRKAQKLTNQEATMLLQDEIYVTIKMDNHREPGCYIDLEDFYVHTDAREKRIDKLRGLLEDELATACAEALKSAHNQRDDTTCEETLEGLAEANDYTFTRTGKLYNERKGDVIEEEDEEDEEEDD